MGALLSALQNLAQRTARFTAAEAGAIYNRLWMVLIIPFVVCVIAFAVNVWFGDYKVWSLFLAITLMVGALFVWAQPLNLLYVTGGGVAKRIIATSGSLASDVDVLFKEYLAILKWILVITIPFLLLAGTIPFQENPKAVSTVIVAALVMWVFTWMWPDIFTGTRGRRLIYAFAVCVIAVSLGSLVPGPTWKKWTGWDPLTAKTTSTDEAIYHLERVRREMADADRATELERIAKKITRREALTAAEERFIVEAKQSQSEKQPTSKTPVAQAPAQTTCPDVTSREMRSCLITNEWSNWIRLADGARDNGKKICHSLGVESERTDNGATLIRFKTLSGKVEVKYRLYPIDTSCSIEGF